MTYSQLLFVNKVELKLHYILCTPYKSREFKASSQSSNPAPLWLLMTVTFHALPRTWQAQSAAAKLLTRIRNWKHTAWSAANRNARSVFLSLQDFPAEQHTRRGRETRGMEGKREEMNGISHLPAEIKWGSVCSRQHAYAQRGHRTFVSSCLCARVWPAGTDL